LPENFSESAHTQERRLYEQVTTNEKSFFRVVKQLDMFRDCAQGADRAAAGSLVAEAALLEHGAGGPAD
jgi:hypothetical protein